MKDSCREAGAQTRLAMGEFGERIAADALQFERRFAASPQHVWRAITTPRALAQWLGEPVRIEPRPGGAFEIRFNAEDRMAGRVVTFEPEQRLVLAWREDTNGVSSGHATSVDDESLVSFELTREPDGGTTLVFTHRSIRGGDEMRGFAGGWHAHLTALEALVDGKELPDRTALYERVSAVYAERITD